MLTRGGVSLTPPMIRQIKQIIRSVSIEDCNSVARKVLTMNSEKQISRFLRDAARKILPEAF
jgi:phosphoenolpyruvate-protein kinase (PTS system EI component)